MGFGTLNNILSINRKNLAENLKNMNYITLRQTPQPKEQHNSTLNLHDPSTHLIRLTMRDQMNLDELAQ